MKTITCKQLKSNKKIDYSSISEKITGLKNADLELREKLIRKGLLGKGYNGEMERLHNKNAKILNEIIDTIGYPTIDKVGEEANEAAWLVIQHAISKPEFMKRCVKLLEDVVKEQKATKKSLAYLTDRIAVFEEKPQLYGTQFDWDENNEMSPQHYEDLDKVNQRRKSIGLNTLEEQTELVRNRVKSENQSPPEDIEKRQQELKEWKKRVGWIK